MEGERFSFGMHRTNLATADGDGILPLKKQVAVRLVVVVPTAEGFISAIEEFQAGNALDMAVAKSDVVAATMPLLNSLNDVCIQRLNSLP